MFLTYMKLTMQNKNLECKITWLIVITVLFLLMGFVGGVSCIGTNEILKFADATQAAEELGTENSTVLANNEFGFQLFQRLYQKNENVFVSPLSISTAITMTLNGAVGTTQQEMKQALSLADLDLVAVNTDFANLQKSLQITSPRIKLKIANSLWGREDILFEPSFLQINKDYFNATLRKVNFKDPESTTDINRWVRDKTNGKIDKIVEELDPQTILFLINAIYFKGNWTKNFDSKKTSERKFFLSDNRIKTVEMMSQSGKYEAYISPDFQAIRLPYDNGRLGMYIFLPDTKYTLTNWISQLTASNWKLWRSQFVEQEADIALPKFKIEYEKSLNSYLSALGMKLAFIPNEANFSSISRDPSDLYIGEVKHKSYIEVTEKGTEAAAITSVQVKTTAIQPDQLYFIANRPFTFVIEDQWTGSLLFLGAVVNP